MTTYELIIDKKIKVLGLKKFQENESKHVMQASLVSGVLAALFTNGMEVIVVRQQSESGETVQQILKQEGIKILTKGLGAKLLLTTCSSFMFFMSMFYAGKVFNTNLSEERE